MPTKKLIMLLMVVGSVVGTYVPVLLGASTFGFVSLLGGAVGAIAGIWLAFRISR
ncbi:MAG: hypothetical protein NT145_06080 [Elusimicrobia bacterium]|nr:hypothetical protein [Elusimicrobiota bacterium]